MTDPSDFLANALGARLSMQIALSSQPVVEEWMDTELTNWLESVPTPMEMPAGEQAEFRVKVASDLSRLSWSAMGHPSGIIPKLSKYLDKCGAKEGDLARINAIGENYEPEKVGSWIEVTPGKVQTGWQFQHDFEIGEIAPHLGGGAEPVLTWAAANGVSAVGNVSAPLESDHTTIMLPVSDPAAPELVASALAALSSTQAADPMVEFLRQSRVENIAIIVSYSVHGVARVAVTFAAVKSDDLPSLCRAIGAPYDAGILPLGGALGSTGIARLVCGIDGETPFADAVFVPGTREPAKPGN